MIALIEGALGLGFLGLVVGYLPVFYESFARRELRSGLLVHAPGDPSRFEQHLSAWEEWCAQVLESQLSFPMLAYFRIALHRAFAAQPL